MAGHSKWANIQHRKGAQDKKRASLFSKLAKEIAVAARLGDPDVNSNPRLRLAVTTARGLSMPKDNIERAIKKGSGELNEGASYTETRYEGYGPSGSALIIEGLTDNKNRSAGEVRAVFSKRGFNLGEPGSVAYNFNQVGEIIFNKEIGQDDEVFEFALEAGADDIYSSDEEHVITTEMTSLHSVVATLSDKYGDPKSAKIIWLPSLEIDLNEDDAKKALALIDVLEELDDVQNVYSNISISDEILEKISNG